MTERVLAAIVVVIAALLVASAAFMAMVVALRAGHTRARRRAEDQQARWRDPLVQAVAGDAPIETIQERVRPGEEIEFLTFLLRFSRQLRGEEARTVAAIGAPFLDVAARDVGNCTPERRAMAIQALAAFGMPAHARAVLDALDDASPYVAVTAAQALAASGHEESAIQVMRRVRRFGSWSAEYLSAMIARIGMAAAAPARALLADVAQPAHARVVAARVLTRLNDPAAADSACDVLTLLLASPWSSVTVQAACLRLLAQVGGGRPAHLDIARRYASSTHPIVRGEAVRALVVLGGLGELQAIAAALRDESRWVAQEAARGMVRLGQLDALRAVGNEAAPNALVLQQVLAGAGARA